jgi:hypothetical protein
MAEQIAALWPYLATALLAGVVGALLVLAAARAAGRRTPGPLSRVIEPPPANVIAFPDPKRRQQRRAGRGR